MFTTLYISILPLLDFIVLMVLPYDGAKFINREFTGFIFPYFALFYIPATILISFKYQIEKYGEKIIRIVPVVCIVIIYHAIPRSFSKNIIENEFIHSDKPSTPIHLLIFDGMSHEVLNDPDLKHLFPNISSFLRNNSFVFEDAYSPGAWTIRSIPKLITGLQYDGRYS